MPLFVITAFDNPGALQVRIDTRDTHLAYLNASGMVKVAGPLLDADGQMIGSLLIVEAQDKAAAQAFADADPYKLAGLFARSELHGWRHSVGQLP
jgi:uncharacterized protein YciI